METKTIELNHLKSYQEYIEELKEIHDELGVSIGTDTLIESDLKLLTRADEIMLIITFMQHALDRKEGESVEEVRS